MSDMMIIGNNRLMLNKATMNRIVEDALNGSFYSSTTKITVTDITYNGTAVEFEVKIQPKEEKKA